MVIPALSVILFILIVPFSAAVAIKYAVLRQGGQEGQMR